LKEAGGYTDTEQTDHLPTPLMLIYRDLEMSMREEMIDLFEFHCATGYKVSANELSNSVSLACGLDRTRREKEGSE
jgi:hypothetical protein